jgi:hypothetical protein
MALIAYKRTPHSPPLPSLSPPSYCILHPALCDMNTIIGSRGDSSSVMMWILAGCAGTYSVHEAWHRLTRVDHRSQYSFYLAQEPFSISHIVGVQMPLQRRHQSQLRRITVSLRPPRTSPTLPQDAIRGGVNARRGRLHTSMSPSSPSPSISTTT